MNFNYEPGVGWTQEGLLAPPDALPGDGFGQAVATFNGQVLVSSPVSDAFAPNAGRLYYYADTPIGVGCDSSFVRGDCNTDGSKNIADAVFELSALFPVGPPASVSCDDACDANDDGVINIADPVALLNELFGAPSLPLPPPALCDVDPTPDGANCVMNAACP